MGDGDQLIKKARDWAVILPGLLVSDLTRSVETYTRLFGFELIHTEPEKLAVVEHGGEQLILRQYRPDDPLVVAELSSPFGRGITLSVRTPDPKTIYEALRAEKYPVLVPMELAELVEGDDTVTMMSFVVQDPDGYVLSFRD